jgi:hypothetical protein
LLPPQQTGGILAQKHTQNTQSCLHAINRKENNKQKNQKKFSKSRQQKAQ